MMLLWRYTVAFLLVVLSTSAGQVDFEACLTDCETKNETGAEVPGCVPSLTNLLVLDHYDSLCKASCAAEGRAAVVARQCSDYYYELVSSRGPIMFDGSDRDDSYGVRLTGVPTISSAFAVAISFTQNANTSAYLFSKMKNEGGRTEYTRIYSVLSYQDDARNQIFFIHHNPNTGIDLSVRMNLPTGVVLANGEQHHVVITVLNQRVYVYIDEHETAISASLSTPITDCGRSLASPLANSDCAFVLGAYLTDIEDEVLPFSGTIHGARLYYSHSLFGFPASYADSISKDMIFLASLTTSTTSATSVTTTNTCPPNQYRTLNEGCVDRDPCDSDEFEVSRGTATTDRECRKVKTCNAGSWESEEPTATSNRVCATCSEGTTDHDSDPTTPCVPCIPGHYVPAGSAGSCTLYACPAGTTDHNEDATDQCLPCPTGFYLPEGSFGRCEKFFCSSGFTDHDEDNKTPCLSCEGVGGVYTGRGSFGPCSKYQCAAGTADLDGLAFSACSACDGNTNYQDLPGQRTCKDTTQCAPGQELSVEATPTTNRECSDCLIGLTYSTDGSTCERVSECEDGFVESVPPTLSSDRQCRDACEGIVCPTLECYERNECVKGECVPRAQRPNGFTCMKNIECKLDGQCLEGACVPGSNVQDNTGCTSTYCTNQELPNICRGGKCGQLEFIEENQAEWTECVAPVTTVETTTVSRNCPEGYYEVNVCHLFESEDVCRTSNESSHCEFNEELDICSSRTDLADGEVISSNRGDRLCRRLQICPFTILTIDSVDVIIGLYESVKPTTTSDRDCNPLTVCFEGQYEATPPQLSSSFAPNRDIQAQYISENRVCEAIRECQEGEYENMAPTSTSNRGCQPVTVLCGSDEYEAAPPTPTSDRNCTKVSPSCEIGFYEMQSPSSFADRICQICEAGYIDDDEDPLTACVVCLSGTYQNEEGQTTCKPTNLVCPAGSAETAPPTISSQRVCTECDGTTTYQDVAGSTECKNISTCFAGTIVVGEPTKSSDRQCLSCNGVSEYQDSDMMDECKLVSPRCDIGKFEVSSPTPSSDRVCEDCLAELGVYQNEPDQMECKTISNCGPGFVQLESPTGSSDRQCEACDGVQFYQNETNALSCKEMTQCDLSVEFISVPGTPSSDTQCQILRDCNVTDAFNSNNLNGTQDRFCKTLRQCQFPEEYEAFPSTATTDRVCGLVSNCTDNEYQSSEPTPTEDRVCNQCSECGEENFQVSGCSETQDAICAQCSECDEGVSFAEKQCSKLQDRVCSPCTVCTGADDQDGGTFVTAACTVSHDTVCTQCSVCLDWEFVSEPCSEKMDTQCSQYCGLSTTVEEPSSLEDFTWNERVYTDLNSIECKVVTSCLDGIEYMDAAPTLTSDTVCQPLTDCEATDSYIVFSETPTSDRVCKQRTQCQDGEFEARSGSVVSDRECQQLSNCTETEFILVLESATSDRVCQQKTVCSESEYSLFEGSETEDRRCEPRPICDEFGPSSNLTSSNVSCIELSISEDDEAFCDAWSITCFEFGAILILAFLLLLVAIFLVRRCFTISLATIGEKGKSVSINAGAVHPKKDNEFPKGEFWRLYEESMEIVPVDTYIRKRPRACDEGSKDVDDSDNDYSDDEVVGEYVINPSPYPLIIEPSQLEDPKDTIVLKNRTYLATPTRPDRSTSSVPQQSVPQSPIPKAKEEPATPHKEQPASAAQLQATPATPARAPAPLQVPQSTPMAPMQPVQMMYGMPSPQPVYYGTPMPMTYAPVTQVAPLSPTLQISGTTDLDEETKL